MRLVFDCLLCGLDWRRDVAWERDLLAWLDHLDQRPECPRCGGDSVHVKAEVSDEAVS